MDSENEVVCTARIIPPERGPAAPAAVTCCYCCPPLPHWPPLTLRRQILGEVCDPCSKYLAKTGHVR